MRVLWNPKYYTQWQNALRPWTWGWLYWAALVSVALNVFWVAISIVKRPQPTVFDRYTKM